MVNIASHLYDMAQRIFSNKEYIYEIEEIISMLNNLSNKDVLEIGAGTCKVGSTIKKKYPTANVWCSDISKSHLQLGLKKAKINTILSRTELLDKKTKKRFDVIIGIDTLHHHENRILALKNTYNLLKKNGMLVIRDVSRLLPGFRIYKLIDKTDLIASKLQGIKYISPAYFSSEEFKLLLGYIGFKEIKIKKLKKHGLIFVSAKK